MVTIVGGEEGGTTVKSLLLEHRCHTTEAQYPQGRQLDSRGAQPHHHHEKRLGAGRASECSLVDEVQAENFSHLSFQNYCYFDFRFALPTRV